MKTAQPFIPSSTNLNTLRKAASACRGCDLYRHATQVVFGEGPSTARIILLGEQPGNVEDKEGRPFVGPAGRLLDKALSEIGLERNEVYISNVVKHFKFKWKGKIRFHQKPTNLEVHACRPWLEAEMSSIEPAVTVCMGVTAAQSVLQRPVTLKKERGELLDCPFGGHLLLTVHPSSILRMPDEKSRHREYGGFVLDLKQIKKGLRSHGRVVNELSRGDL